MTHPSRRRSVKCISWPGLAHPNLNSLSRSLFPHLRASVTLRHACSSSSLQPPQLPLASLPSGLAHFLRSPLRRRPTKSSRLSGAHDEKTSQSRALYVRCRLARKVTSRCNGTGTKGEEKMRTTRGREKSARPRLPLREIREIPREEETRGVCQYYNFIDTSLSLYPVVSLSSFLPLSLVGESFALAIESERIAVLLRTFFSPFLFCFLLSFFFYEHRIPRTQRQ